MNTNIAAASYHPRILSLKYGQTGNVKPLTANRRSLSFAVKWPNLDLKVSIVMNEDFRALKDALENLNTHGKAHQKGFYQEFCRKFRKLVKIT